MKGKLGILLLVVVSFIAGVFLTKLSINGLLFQSETNKAVGTSQQEGTKTFKTGAYNINYPSDWTNPASFPKLNCFPQTYGQVVDITALIGLGLTQSQAQMIINLTQSESVKQPMRQVCFDQKKLLVAYKMSEYLEEPTNQTLGIINLLTKDNVFKTVSAEKCIGAIQAINDENTVLSVCDRSDGPVSAKVLVATVLNSPVAIEACTQEPGKAYECHSN